MADFKPTHRVNGAELMLHHETHEQAFYTDFSGRTYLLPLHIAKEIQDPPREGEVWVYKFSGENLLVNSAGDLVDKEGMVVWFADGRDPEQPKLSKFYKVV